MPFKYEYMVLFKNILIVTLKESLIVIFSSVLIIRIPYLIGQSPVICVAPPTPRNGRIIGGEGASYREGDMISYRCDPGFMLVGNVKRLCQSNGKFTGQEPICDIAQGTCIMYNVITTCTLYCRINVYLN